MTLLHAGGWQAIGCLEETPDIFWYLFHGCKSSAVCGFTEGNTGETRMWPLGFKLLTNHHHLLSHSPYFIAHCLAALVTQLNYHFATCSEALEIEITWTGDCCMKLQKIPPLQKVSNNTVWVEHFISLPLNGGVGRIASHKV